MQKEKTMEGKPGQVNPPNRGLINRDDVPLTIQVLGTLLHGDRKSSGRNRREDQPSACDVQSTASLVVVEAQDFAPHKRLHL